MGRPRGRKDSKPRDPTANRANARKSRRAFTGDLRELAKSVLGPALAEHGFNHIADLIREGPHGIVQVGEGGKAFWVDRLDRFKWACEFSAGRIGLPPVQVAEVSGEIVMPIEIVFKHGGSVPQ